MSRNVLEITSTTAWFDQQLNLLGPKFSIKRETRSRSEEIWKCLFPVKTRYWKFLIYLKPVRESMENRNLRVFFAKFIKYRRHCKAIFWLQKFNRWCSKLVRHYFQNYNPQNRKLNRKMHQWMHTWWKCWIAKTFLSSLTTDLNKKIKDKQNKLRVK